MKKRLLALTILSILSANASFAATNKTGATDNISASDTASIKAIIEEIAAAAQSGDEQLVAKLLSSAIKSNPQLADKIVAAFVDSQSVISSNSKTKTVNVASIINDVIANLQNQPGNEALIASVLNSYTPAAGGENKKAVGDNSLPPSLPSSGKVGGNNSDDSVSKQLPQENKSQTSAH